jgi:hypothetical protein
MCSLELYNWYENRFPNDFKQLIKIKHYSISDLSFMLSKIWSKLDHGEKLLMCAIYYDDFDLAKQMLDEKFMFRVNPFYGKRYFTQSPHRAYLSSSGSSYSVSFPTNDFDININSDVFGNTDENSNHNNNNIPPKVSKHYCSSDKECWCLNETTINTRLSFSSYTNLDSILNDNNSDNENETNNNNNNHRPVNLDMHLRNILTNSSNPAQTNFLNDEPAYYFDQIFYDFYMQSPFYFAIKFNKLKMCQLFIERIKSIFLTSLNAKSRRQQLFLRGSNQRDLNIFYHHKQCINTYLNKKNFKIYLNSMISDEELSNLLVLALSNKNYDIAMLILANVNNAKKILNFHTLSESFIYNKEFCLYLIRNRVVEPHVMLKEATNRHSAEVTSLIIDYLEHEDKEYRKKSNDLFNLYKIILNNSIAIGDLNIFRLAIKKLNKLLDRFQIDQEKFNKLFNDLTIENILSENGNNKSIKKRVRSRAYRSNQIDTNSTKLMAIEKEFDWDSFFVTNDLEDGKSNKSKNSKLTQLNRLRLMKYLFNKTNQPNSHLNSIEHLSQEIGALWLDMEQLIKKNLNSFDSLFAADNEQQKCMITSTLTKRVYLGHYLVLNESEPFLVNELISNSRETYKLTNRDLISVAKNGSSELTLYYLLNNLQFDHENDKTTSELLKPNDDVYGNFLEILFCRLVRCTNKEQELRLKRLFFESILLKNAKLTCSTNMLNLFLTNNQDIKHRLINKYFPCLFYLSNSFALFQTNLHQKRFTMLTNWLAKQLFFSKSAIYASNLSTMFQFDTLSKQQIEMILFEYYKKRCLLKANQQINLSPFEFSLKELARISFLKVYLKHDKTYLDFINEINESTRQFILCFNEIKYLCN